VWVGYDSNQSLGDKETGAKAALPIWMTVMKQAIVGREDEKFLSDDPKAMQVAQTQPAGATPNAGAAKMPVSASAVPGQTVAKPGVPAALNANGAKPGVGNALKPAKPAPKKAPQVVSPAAANKLDSILN
jgi:penicillin-binding protein 1A